MYFFFFKKNILYDLSLYPLWKNFLEPPLRTALSNLHLQVFKIYIMLTIQRTPTHRTLLCSDLRYFPQIIRSQFQNCKFVSVSILLIVVCLIISKSSRFILCWLFYGGLQVSNTRYSANIISTIIRRQFQNS